MAVRDFGQGADNRWTLAAILAGVASVFIMPVSAGLLTTQRTVADFTFVGAAVDYAPDPKTFALSRESAFAFTATDPDLGLSDIGNTHDTLRGALHLAAKTDNFGHFIGADFNVFGSLPTLATMPEAALAVDTVKALRPDSKPGTLEFMIDRDLIVGPLASRYRGVGIFMLVAGVDQMSWVQGFADGASTMQLLSVEDAVANGTKPPGDIKAIPLPATLALVALGLPLLRRCRFTC